MDMSAENAQVTEDVPTRPRGLFLGIALTVIGALWLLWNFDVVDGFWVERYGILLIGLSLLVRTVYTKTYWLFPGALLAGLGAFHVYLDNQPLYAMRQLWPVYFLIMSGAFLMNYAANMRRWISLILGLLTASIGGIWLGRELFGMDYEWVVLAKIYWPLLFIISGSIMVAVTLIRKRRM